MLVDVNQRLLDNKIDVKTANQIAINTQTIINAVKVSIEAMKVTEQKANEFIIFTEPIEFTLKEIEDRNKQPYKTSDRVETIIANAHR